MTLEAEIGSIVRQATQDALREILDDLEQRMGAIARPLNVYLDDDLNISLSLQEAAKRTGLSHTTVKQLVRRGEIPAFSVGRRRLILVTSLKTWAREQQEAAGWHTEMAPRTATS